MFVRQKGSHMILRRGDPCKIIVVPDHRQIKPGTLRGIIADAGFAVDELVGPLK